MVPWFPWYCTSVPLVLYRGSPGTVPWFPWYCTVVPLVPHHGSPGPALTLVELPYHELLPGQAHPLWAALDQQRGGALRGTEVRQDDLGVGLVHDGKEVRSILTQHEEVLLGGDVQLGGDDQPRPLTPHLRAQQQLHQDAYRLL